MYIPNHYQGKDIKQAIAFMQRFNFGIIVSIEEANPIATHLPFSIKEEEGTITLTSHFARANTQWENIVAQKTLTIFSEPHAYISPTFYNKKQNVPTWNYLSVHAYGDCQLFEKTEDKYRILDTMINDFEPAYKKQWEELSPKYKTAMLSGIVAFEITVTELQFKEKLSQNKKKEERMNIIDHFSKSEDSNEKWMARYMKEG